MEQDIVKAAMAAISTAYAGRAADFSVEQVKGWFDRATGSLGQKSRLSSEDIQAMANRVLSKTPVLEAEISMRNLARWFEVPGEEFHLTPREQLEPEVLIRHLYLENLFSDWLKEWGYLISIGEDLEGLESIDFTPDVYGRLETVHGLFEICINLVCDNPPSQYRVRALLETLEAYATDRSEFNWGDVYILATPFKFGRGAAASIRLQSKEEKYTVIKLEGEDIHNLVNARDNDARLVQLMQHVERARRQGPQKEV